MNASAKTTKSKSLSESNKTCGFNKQKASGAFSRVYLICQSDSGVQDTEMKEERNVIEND